MLSSSRPAATAFPVIAAGRLLHIAFEACSAFTHVTACLLAESPKATLSQSISPPSSLRLLPAGTTVAGRDSHPLKVDAFSRHTQYSLFMHGCERPFARKNMHGINMA